MEGNLSAANMISGGGSYRGIHLQGSMRVDHHQHHHHHSLPREGSMVHPSIHEDLPLSIRSTQDNDQRISLADYDKEEKGKASASDEDEPSYMEDTGDGHSDLNRGKKMSPWRRVKWTDTMVRLLITAVSYIGEESSAEYGGARRKYANLQIKGKWKLVSKVMAERGHFVSPQQCEDKFNDLNKRYKRLNEILGRGTSCEVVENPMLLDMMDHVSEKAKEEVRKILSSKHLYYEEMCSYHNSNRLHLPPDPELQHSLRLALRSRDDNDKNDVRRHLPDGFDEDDHDIEMDDHDEFEENHGLHENRGGIFETQGTSSKRIKQLQGCGDLGFCNSSISLDCNKAFSFQPQGVHVDVNQVLPESMKADMTQQQWMKHRSLQLEQQKLQIQAQMLELEKERFKWQRFCKKKDRELEIFRMENERMKLQNEHMALELKRREMGGDSN